MSEREDECPTVLVPELNVHVATRRVQAPRLPTRAILHPLSVSRIHRIAAQAAAADRRRRRQELAAALALLGASFLLALAIAC